MIISAINCKQRNEIEWWGRRESWIADSRCLLPWLPSTEGLHLINTCWRPPPLTYLTRSTFMALIPRHYTQQRQCTSLNGEEYAAIKRGTAGKRVWNGWMLAISSLLQSLGATRLSRNGWRWSQASNTRGLLNPLLGSLGNRTRCCGMYLKLFVFSLALLRFLSLSESLCLLSLLSLLALIWH